MCRERLKWRSSSIALSDNLSITSRITWKSAIYLEIVEQLRRSLERNTTRVLHLLVASGLYYESPFAFGSHQEARE